MLSGVGVGGKEEEMKKLGIALLVGYMAFAVVAEADFDWFNTATNRIAYADGVTYLHGHRTNYLEACFVQLIWAGPDNEIDPAINSGQGVTGDDQVHAWSWFGRNRFADPDGVMPDAPTLTADSNGFYYVRAWTAPSPDYDNGLVPTSPTNFYGNSALWNNPGNEPGPDKFDFGGAGDANNVGWSCNLSPIPEPTIAGLGLLGALALRMARKRRTA